MTALHVKKTLIIIAAVLFASVSCSSKKAVKYTRDTLPPKANIAVIIDVPNNLKNVVLAKFLEKGFSVKAMNASDMYSMSEIFDIKDMKRLSYSSSADNSLLSMEKTYNNIYKLHIYDFEINKAQLLSEIKSKWDVDYLVLMDLKDWKSVSWARIINLKNYEVMWLENYPTGYKDNVETIMDHFINSMTASK
ncbi:MAG TPA: hypothetical protein PK926_14185 [Spirochaetota bacterium]|nr:hypothetical protein [Spirochaetota bacterium]HPI88277.1 hypothetical protein [Spirochaetota bacterium]HPR49193.1 hypothetical protein [Spirochaetota bacterium]